MIWKRTGLRVTLLPSLEGQKLSTFATVERRSDGLKIQGLLSVEGISHDLAVKQHSS